MYIPKAQSLHRAPKVKHTYKNGERGRGRGRGGRGRGGQKKQAHDIPGGIDRRIGKGKNQKVDEAAREKDGVENMEELLEEKIMLAMDVTGSELITERRHKVDNPPVIIIASWHIT